MGSLTQAQNDQILEVHTFTALLSLISTIIMFIAIFGITRPNLRKSRAMRMLVSLNTISFLSSIVNLWSWPDTNFRNTKLCFFQGFFMQLTQMSENVWILAIAVDLFLVVNIYSLKQNQEALHKFEIAYHAVCWGVPLVLALLPLSTSSYGFSGAWCWMVNTDPASNAWRFVVFYIPLYIFIISIFVLYGLVGRHMYTSFKSVSGAKSEDVLKSEKKYLYKMVAYPIGFLLIWLVPLINRIQNWAAPENPIFGLFVVQAFTDPLLGFTNAVIYLSGRQFRTKLKLLIKNNVTSSKATDMELTNMPDTNNA